MEDPSRTQPTVAGDSTVTLLTELTAISSPSGDAPGLRRMAERLGEELGRRGLHVEILEREGAEDKLLPVLYARGPRSGPSTLLVVGHIDTVLPAREPLRRGSRLYASGAIDMKGGWAAFLSALDLLAQRREPLPEGLELVAVPDEEVGGEISHWAVENWGGRARTLWVLEPGESRGERETIVGGRRGLFHWQLEAEGKSAHSGLDFWRGRSAVAAAAEWAAAASQLSAPARGPTVNVARFVGGDRPFVADLASETAVLRTAQRLNVVADRALVEGEARFLDAGEGALLAARLAEIARQIGGRLEVELRLTIGRWIPPVTSSGRDRPWLDRAVAFAAQRGWRLEIEEERGGISFPNFLADPSRLFVLDGLGPVGAGMHTSEEYVEIESLRRRAALLADLLSAADAPGADR